MPINWVTRAYRSGDENKIFELRKAVRPERKYELKSWLKFWHWMYTEIPSGSKTWLAHDNGRVVGQHSCLIKNFKVGNNVIKTALLLDSSTHPDYRRQGINIILSKKARDDLSKSGVQLTVGFPNEATHKKNMKLGFFDVHGEKKMIKVFKWDNALKIWNSNRLFLKLGAFAGSMINNLIYRASKRPVINGLEVTQVPRFDERIDALWDRVSGQIQITAVRSKDYLNWRYTIVPDVNYNIYIAEKGGDVCGYLVLRYFYDEQQNAAIIHDLFTESEKVAQYLLSTVSELCQKDDIDFIYWVGIAPKLYKKAFCKNGYISQPFRKKGNFNVYCNSPDISKEFLSNSENWLIQIGDSDNL